MTAKYVGLDVFGAQVGNRTALKNPISFPIYRWVYYILFPWELFTRNTR